MTRMKKNVRSIAADYQSYDGRGALPVWGGVVDLRGGFDFSWCGYLTLDVSVFGGNNKKKRMGSYAGGETVVSEWCCNEN